MYNPDFEDRPTNEEYAKWAFEKDVEDVIKKAFFNALDQAYDAYAKELEESGLDLSEEASDRIDTFFDAVLSDLETTVEEITFNA